MAKFRKKPVIVDAAQFTGDNYSDICNSLCDGRELGELHRDHIIIYTLEGNMRANIGSVILKGVAGELYPCKPDIFIDTYEATDEESQRMMEKIIKSMED